ncbi:hypothetical protein WJX72_011453 [[Myrmecia] bisecta]|uniref:Uncharacterized protein n=1 Tax=[Myrmecia] bisecta TaxID=41462 RepID=A0AAW1QGQ0_9CHLO
MVTGFLFPAGGIRAADLGLQTLTTTGIFIISGLSLKQGEARDAISAWPAVLYGVVSILFITPLAALLAMRLPLQPPALAFGLAVFCCMPTTLSSGVALTQAVGGNTALALLLTVGTNLLGIFTMPFVLCNLLGTGSGTVALSPGPLLRSLIKTILVPLLCGAAARQYIPGVAKAVDGNKRALSMLSAVLLSLVPWMQISRAVTSDVAVSVGALVAVVAAGVAIHLLYLAFNTAAVRALGIGGRSGPQAVAIQRALVLVGSQKTLPIAVVVLNSCTAILGSSVGLAVIPCVGSHLLQILVDSILVSAWLRSDRIAAGRES